MIESFNVFLVPQTRFLGVLIDKKIVWKKHIDFICGKMMKCIGVMSRVHGFINCSCMYSYLYIRTEHFALVFGVLPVSQMFLRFH